MHSNGTTTMKFPGTCLTAAAALTLLLAALPGPADARIKCWTNSDGVRECGNTVPPEYAQQGHRELNKHGVTVGRQGRAMTTQEVEAERRKAELAEEQRRKAKEQAALDRVLLDTFGSEDDLVLTRDGKLRAIDSRIHLTEKLVVNLNETLDKMKAEAASQERSGNPVTDKLQADILDIERQIETHRKFIENRRLEKETVRARFEADLARYRELTASRNR